MINPAPGPRYNPLALNLIRFRRDPLSFLQWLTKQYGDFARFWMGGQQMFFVNHPDYIRDVLVTYNSNFVKGRALQRAKRLLGQGLLTSEGLLPLVLLGPIVAVLLGYAVLGQSLSALQFAGIVIAGAALVSGQIIAARHHAQALAAARAV